MKNRVVVAVVAALLVATIASATCLPCIKEILNNSAAHAVENLTIANSKVEALVAAGRMTPADAATFQRKSVELEQKFCYDVEELLKKHYVEKVKNPY